jgi:S1-C subfamily serine protease
MPKSVLLFALLLAAPVLAKDNVVRGWLGFGFVTHHARDGHVDFLHVRNVAVPGPSHRAGLKPFDVIVALNGFPVRFADDRAALAFFAKLKVAERVVFTVVWY